MSRAATAHSGPEVGPTNSAASPVQQLAREQAYVDVLYARVDELMVQLQESLDAVQGSQQASTHQNRSERDAFLALYEDRLSLLRTVAHNVVFGRLDSQEGEHHYIGRIGLFTPEREQLLVDWRAPAAAAYYQATPVEPMGVRLRRHLICSDRTVVSLEDDVLDAEMLRGGSAVGGGTGTASSPALQGEGALLAAVTAGRTGRMGDIVSTIQAEQDRIIRADTRGVQVVQGGPGTGKTAVALHRAAYLLYTHRKRLEHTGVLVVAPTAGFLRYIERVLPSLGESGVVMLTPGDLYPGVSATVPDRASVARVKGDLSMADLLARAVRDRQIVPEADTRFTIDGTSFVLRRKDVEAARREARATHKPHNQARAVFVRAVLERLLDAFASALETQGQTILPEDRPDLLADLRGDPEIRRAVNLAWMPYTPEGFLRILLSRPERLRSAAPRALSGRDLEHLVRPKDSPLTIEDVPLLDELAELLGQDEAAERQEAERRGRKRDQDIEYAREVIENIDTSGMIRAEDLADSVANRGDGRSLAERALGDRSWTYGHVVVDEAQELSAMMWRVLMRRCPTKSFTVVGDVAQTSSPAGTSSWERALSPYVEDRLEVAELSVNYRTPRRIMDVALRMARTHDLPVSPVRSVREGDQDVRIHEADEDELVGRCTEVVLEQREQGMARVAVIAPADLVHPIAQDLTERLGPQGRSLVREGSTGIDAEVAVMTAHAAKGLEFDAVVIAEPERLAEDADADEVIGSLPPFGDLFVAMTRPTRSLEIVHALPLPDGVAAP
jgi:DNA helicase IV